MRIPIYKHEIFPKMIFIIEKFQIDQEPENYIYYHKN
jgi:hypothetical protein